MNQIANSFEYFLTLAKTQISEGKLQSALVSYKKALASNPKEASIYCRLGDFYLLHLQQLPPALSYYEQALQIKPNFFWAIRGKGDVLLEQNKLEEAIETYSHAIRIAPDNYEGYRNLAKALEKQGDLEKAKYNLDKASQIKPDNPWLLIKLGDISVLLNQPEETLKYYQQALKLNPDNIESLYSKLGKLCFYNLGKYEEAIFWYSQLLEKQPDNFFATRDLGGTFDKLGKSEEALATYEKTIEIVINQEEIGKDILWGGIEEVYIHIGRLQTQQGKINQRDTTYKQGISFAQNRIIQEPDKPDFYQLYESLENLLDADQSWQNITNFYIKISNQYPHSFEINYRLGKIFAQKQKWNQALKYYQKTIEINPNHWEAYEAKGEALVAIGLTEEAHNSYRMAEQTFFQTTTLNKSDLPNNFDWEIYYPFNPGVGAKTKWQAIEHFLLYGNKSKKIYAIEHLHSPELRINIAPKSAIIFSEYKPNNNNQKLAVLLHLYYGELWEEIWNYIQNIESEYDLFINLVASMWNPMIHRQIKKAAPHARIIISKNRGRDLGGHLASMDTLDFNKYDIFCLLHSKKSLHLTPKISTLWRQDLISALLGSKEKVRENLQILRQNPEIGCIGSRYWRDTNLGQNQQYYNHFLDVLQIKPEARNCEYISGTMMLVRTKVMKRIYDVFSKIDLEEGDDKGLEFHLDGQIAHAIERLIGNVVRDENLSFFWQE